MRRCPLLEDHFATLEMENELERLDLGTLDVNLRYRTTNLI